jgi:hypothetical protein
LGKQVFTLPFPVEPLLFPDETSFLGFVAGMSEVGPGTPGEHPRSGLLQDRAFISGRVVLADRYGMRTAVKDTMEVAISDHIQVLPDDGSEILFLCIKDRRKPSGSLSLTGMVDHLYRAADQECRYIFGNNVIACSGDFHGQSPTRTPCGAGMGV